ERFSLEGRKEPREDTAFWIWEAWVSKIFSSCVATWEEFEGPCSLSVLLCCSFVRGSLYGIDFILTIYWGAWEVAQNVFAKNMRIHIETIVKVAVEPIFNHFDPVWITDGLKLAKVRIWGIRTIPPGADPNNLGVEEQDLHDATKD
ncbi:hypothetical protein ACJX0J_036956, partial [Zea mays]